MGVSIRPWCMLMSSLSVSIAFMPCFSFVWSVFECNSMWMQWWSSFYKGFSNAVSCLVWPIQGQTEHSNFSSLPPQHKEFGINDKLSYQTSIANFSSSFGAFAYLCQLLRLIFYLPAYKGSLFVSLCPRHSKGRKQSCMRDSKHATCCM